MAINRILVLSNNPDRASFRQRIGVYLPCLETDGIASTVVKFPDSYLARWKMFRQAGRFDAVLLHKKTLNFWDAHFLRKYARKIIYDFDDAIMLSPRKPDCRHSSHKRLFGRTAKLADCVIAGNPYLADHARPFCWNVHILPTGLDTKKYDIASKPVSDGKIRLVWIGSKATLGYLKELTPALERIGKECPTVVLRIICDTFFDLKQMPVEQKRWSLDTEAMDLAACAIGLCPLPDDHYTRGKCGFKILQCFAAGLPAIASPVGFNKELVIPDKTGFLASSEEQWVKTLKRLIENESLRQTMGQQAKQFVRNYDTAAIGEQFCAFIKQALQ
jgi:glycosyltransferase involved in cell wall biosynthesis